MTNILNLGAGATPIDGAVNHDIAAHSPHIDAVWDLNDMPWALWRDAQFDTLHLISVIEHLIPTPIQTLNECWRILKPGGVLHIKYPTHTSPTIHDDPTHRWFLSVRSLDYVDPNTTYGSEYSFYTPRKWRIEAKAHIKERSLKARLRKLV